MQPTVSILIPAFNAQHWLADSIQSALTQTWPNKEIIVVDDGSRDQTLVLARQFESPRIKVFSHPHQGASATRNKALSLALGDYIQWLDADDFLAPDKIATQLAAIAPSFNHKTLLSSAWAAFISDLAAHSSFPIRYGTI